MVQGELAAAFDYIAELRLPMALLLAAKKVKTQGKMRRTKYFSK